MPEAGLNTAITQFEIYVCLRSVNVSKRLGGRVDNNADMVNAVSTRQVKQRNSSRNVFVCHTSYYE